MDYIMATDWLVYGGAGEESNDAPSGGKAHPAGVAAHFAMMTPTGEPKPSSLLPSKTEKGSKEEEEDAKVNTYMIIP